MIIEIILPDIEVVRIFLLSFAPMMIIMIIRFIASFITG